MDKVGRNEPCPCGSGKKYKKCCEQKNNVIRLFSGEITKDEANEVRRLLEMFISDNNFHLSERVDEVFQLEEIAEKNMKSAEGLAFEWFVMDHPFEGEKSFFDYFLREIRGKIDLRLLKKLESWKESYLSVYDVEAHLEDEKILLKDIFTKEEKVLSVLGFENIPKVNDLLVSRLVLVDGIYEYFFGALGIDMFSRKTLIDLLALDKEVENKSWEAFLKEDGEQLVDNIIEMYFRGDDENEPFDEAAAQDYIAFNVAIRSFLTEPQPVLQGKSPLQAVYNPGMEEAIEEFLEGIEFGDYDDEEQYLIRFSAYADEVVDLLTTDVNDLNALLNLQWEKAIYKKEAELFVRKTFGRYFPEDIAKALTVWYEYCALEKPDLRKTGAWASALDQLISGVFVYEDPRSQKEIGESYQVSPITISRNMKKLEVYFYNELQGDEGEVLPSWIEDLDEETLIEMERVTEKLADKLEFGDFQSLDEAGEIPDWLKEMVGSKEVQEMMEMEASEHGERSFRAMDADDMYALSEKIREENEIILDGFHTWLKSQGLAGKTIKTHSNNIEFFINDYLAFHDPVEAREGIDRVSEFLGDWFIRKAMWSTKATVLSNITSIKKFYQFFMEIGEIEKEDFNRLKSIIKEEKDFWIEAVEEYNDY